MSELKDLIARVEALSGADDPTLRYIDCHLWVLAQGGDARMHVCDSSTQDFVWERGIDGMWIRSVVKFRAVPRYTSSIDAALAFAERVLPGFRFSMFTDGGGKGPTCLALLNDEPVKAEGRAPTLPLAIILATLKAKVAE